MIIGSLEWLGAEGALVLDIEPVPQALLVEEVLTAQYQTVVMIGFLKAYFALVGAVGLDFDFLGEIDEHEG